MVATKGAGFTPAPPHAGALGLVVHPATRANQEVRRFLGGGTLAKRGSGLGGTGRSPGKTRLVVYFRCAAACPRMDPGGLRNGPLVAPASSARNARSPHRSFSVVQGMPERCVVLRLGVELHRRIGQHRSLFRRNRRAADDHDRDAEREDQKEKPGHRDSSEVDAQTAGIGLSVFVGVGREYGQIGRFEPHQDTIAQREKKPASRTRDIQVLAAQNE